MSQTPPSWCSSNSGKLFFVCVDPLGRSGERPCMGTYSRLQLAPGHTKHPNIQIYTWDGCIMHILVFSGVWGCLKASKARYVVWGSCDGRSICVPQTTYRTLDAPRHPQTPSNTCISTMQPSQMFIGEFGCLDWPRVRYKRPRSPIMHGLLPDPH